MNILDVQESGGAKEFLEQSVSHWRPRVVEEINKIPLDTDGIWYSPIPLSLSIIIVALFY